MSTPPPRRARRWPVLLGAAVLLLLGAAFAALRVELAGERLGALVADLLNKKMRGRIEIGRIDWPASALPALVTGGWIPLTARDVRVWDDCALSAGFDRDNPDSLRLGDPNRECAEDDRAVPGSARKPRKLLLDAPELTAEIDIHALLFGNHDFVFRRVVVHGGEALIEETTEPYPMHAYDRTIVSIVSAFYPRQKAGFRAGIHADSPPPTFDLRDLHVEHLNLTVHTGTLKEPEGRLGFSFTARIEDVNMDAGPARRDDAFVYNDGTDPLISKFYFRLALHGERATIRLLDKGAREAFRLPRRGEDRCGVTAQRTGAPAGPCPPAGAPGFLPPGRDEPYATIVLDDLDVPRLAQLPLDWARRRYGASTLELDVRARSHAGATLRLAGELASYLDGPYDGRWNLAVDVQNLGPTLREIKPRLGGEDLRGAITLTGPFVARPKIGLDLQNLDVDLPLSRTDPLQLTLAEVHGAIDLVNDQGFIEKTRAVVKPRPGGARSPGEVELSATFGIAPTFANATIDIVKPIDLARFVGAGQARLAATLGTYVGGRLHAVGDTATAFALEDLDLTIGRTPTDRTVRIHHGQVVATDDFGVVTLQRDAGDRPLTIEAGATRAVLSGHLDVTGQALTLDVGFDSPDLAGWLQRLGAPAVATSARAGVVRVRGPLAALRIERSRVDLGGVPGVDALSLDDVALAGGVLDVGAIGSTGLGGRLAGGARLRLADAFLERLELAGDGLDVGRLPGLGGLARGTLDRVEVSARGAVGARRDALGWLGLVSAMLRADHLAIRGDGYSGLALCVNRPGDPACRSPQAPAGVEARAACAEARRRGGTCAEATARRDGGGTLDATIATLPGEPAAGRRDRGGPRLAGDVALLDVPLDVLARLGLVPGGAIGGTVSTTLQLGGSPAAPVADGALRLARAWALGAFLGDGTVEVAPARLADGGPGLTLRGAALGGRLAVSATVGTAPPFPVELELAARRLEVDPFVDLSALTGLGTRDEPLRAWATGRVTVRTELAPRGGRPSPEAWVELDELVAILERRGADGRLAPLRVAALTQALPGDGGGTARPAVSVRLTPDSVELTCRAPGAPGGRVPCSTALSTPAGVVTLAGGATPARVALTADGVLDLALVAPLLDAYFDDVGGQLVVAASITGALARPRYEASVRLVDVRLRPSGQETVVRAPTGLIRLANRTLGFTDVRVRIDDTYLGEAAELVVGGGVRLEGLTPVSWGVLIDGKLAGKMLLAAAPAVFSQATGVATIDETITISGTGARPAVSGTLRFDRAAPLLVIPRGVRRELALQDGTINVETSGADGDAVRYEVTLGDLAGSIDGEGKLRRIRGTLDLRGARLVGADITLDAENLPFRSPGTLDLNVSGSGLHLILAGPDSPWDVEGNVTLVNGTYLRNFELTEAIKPQAPSGGPSQPFWEAYPAIGNATLSLGLDVRRFSIANNIMAIDLTGPNLQIRGTPRDPRLSGSILVQRGAFRIPGTRAKFTRTSGSLDFSESQQFPRNTPTINVSSEADYRDPGGQDHLITATVFGTLSNLQWDLHTSTGYNKAQTLALLVFGQNPDQIRRSLGDQSLGADPTRLDPSTNPTAGPADQIVKDLAGQWVSGLLGDSLRNLTGLDILRFEVSFGSVGVHGERKALENLRFIGDFEQTGYGKTINVRGELRTPYKLSSTGQTLTIQGGYLDKNFNSEAEQDIQDLQVKFVYRIFVP